MARPLRIEFPGVVYHVTSRCTRREDIFVDDQDKQGLLAVAAQALSRLNAETLAEPRNSTDRDVPRVQRRKLRTPAQCGWQAARIGKRRYTEPTRKAR